MWVLLLSAFASAAPSSTILRYEHGSQRYTLEKTAKELAYYGEPATLKVQIQDCNREALSFLWKQIENYHKQLPPAPRRTTASEDLVTLKGTKRALQVNSPVHVKAVRFFNRLPNSFLTTKMASDRQCKR